MLDVDVMPENPFINLPATMRLDPPAGPLQGQATPPNLQAEALTDPVVRPLPPCVIIPCALRCMQGSLQRDTDGDGDETTVKEQELEREEGEEAEAEERQNRQTERGTGGEGERERKRQIRGKRCSLILSRDSPCDQQTLCSQAPCAPG